MTLALKSQAGNQSRCGESSTRMGWRANNNTALSASLGCESLSESARQTLSVSYHTQQLQPDMFYSHMTGLCVHGLTIPILLQQGALQRGGAACM